MATLVAFAVCSVWQMQAERRFVYVAGMNDRWPMPCVEYQDEWDPYRIWETEEGSNVYEGTLTKESPYSLYFRFYTALSPVVASESWRENFIGPKNFTPTPLNSMSGVYSAEDMEICEYAAKIEPETWVIDSYGVKSFWFHLDLNKKELLVIGENAVVPLVNDIKAPTIKDAANLTSINRYNNNTPLETKVFVPAGECSFLFYDFFNKCFVGAESNQLITDRTKELHPKQGSGSLWTIPNWEGGTLTFKGYSLKVDNLGQWKNDQQIDAVWPEEAYIVGDFNDWNIYDAPRMTRIGEEYRYDLPASATSFRITSHPDWEHYALCYDLSTRNGATTFYGVTLDGMYYNLELSSGEPTTIVFNPKERLVYTYPTSQGAPDTMAEDPRVGFGDYTLPSPEYMDYLVAISPDDNLKIDRNNFGYVINNYPRIYQNSDNPGVYEGEIPKMNGVKFLRKVGATAKENEYITPGASDRELTLNRGFASTSYAIGGDDSGYWTGISTVGKVRIDTNSNTYASVQFGDKDQQAYIYVVGTPSDWTTPSESNREFYKDFKLMGTTDGCYYGSVPTVAGSDGKVSFRFFTDLRGWSFDTSWGPAYEDFHEVNVECNPDNSYNLVNGMSNYSFPNCSAERIYILADFESNIVRFSPTPMDVEVGPYAGSPAIYYSREDGSWFHSSGELYHHSDTDKILIHSRPLDFGSEEAEWAGSYLLEPADPEAEIKLDEFGVARIPLVERVGFSTMPGKAISMAKIPAGSYQLKVSPDKKTLSIISRDHYFIVGAPTGNKALTIDNLSDFEGYHTNSNFQGLFYIPAGKFDFHTATLQNPFEGTQSFDIEWKNGMVDAQELGLFNGFAYGNTRFRDPDWQGGYIMITGRYIFDLSKCEAIMASTYIDDAEGGGYAYAHMNKLDAKGSVYKTQVRLKNNGASQAHLIFTALYRETSADYSINYTLAGAPCYVPGLGGPAVGDPNAYFSGDRLVLPLASSSAAYNFPHVSDAVVDVTLNLAEMTATLEVSRMESLDTFNLYSDDAALDGVEGVESGSEANVITATATVPERAEDVKVNFVNSANEIIMPEKDEKVVFDEHGNYSCPFVNPAVGGGSRRKAAAKAGKWIIPSEFTGDEISFRIDNNTGRVHIAASKAVKNYYVIERKDEFDYPFISVFDLKDYNDRMLRKTGENIYEGDINIPASNQIHIGGGYSWNSLILGAFGPRYGFEGANVDMSGSEDPVLLLTPIFNWWSTPFTIEGNDPNVKHHLILNTANYTLTIKKNPSSVKEFESEDALFVEGLKGHILISGNAETDVDIYNIQGQLVKRIHFVGEPLTIDLPSGLYIAAGCKVLVR